MTGKKLVKNLKWLIEPRFSGINVYTFDQNSTRELPCIVIGYKEENPSFPGNHGHFTVKGDVTVLYQGYDDLTNTDADSTSENVINVLTNESLVLSALNKPLSGSDYRPLSGFGINALYVRGTSRNDEDHSTSVSIEFDAFCAAIDFN